MNILVVGSPCAGKTTLCRGLERYGFEHVSIDQFRDKAWDEFTAEDEKRIYNKFFSYISGRDWLAIDTPGISPFFQEKRWILRNAKVIKLEASLETCLKRLERRRQKRDITPELLRWLYSCSTVLKADFVVNTDEHTPSQTLRKVIEFINSSEDEGEDITLDEVVRLREKPFISPKFKMRDIGAIAKLKKDAFLRRVFSRNRL